MSYCNAYCFPNPISTLGILYILINGLAVYLELRASCGKIRNGTNNSQALDTTVAQHHADDLVLPGHQHDDLSTCDDLAFNARSFQADGNSSDLVGTQYAAARQVIAGHFPEYKQLHSYITLCSTAKDH